MPAYEREALSISVATRLRELREGRGISMRSLAAKSGLSANALSMIERGKTSPSVSTLYKLADALGVSITTFFELEQEKKQAVFLKHDERSRMPFTRGIFEALGGEQFSGRVEPFMLTLESGASCGPHDVVHTGHEFVYCLRGQLDYFVEKDIYHLEPGDSLLFATKLRHRWRNPGSTVTNALIIISGFSEGEQPNVMHRRNEDT
ncbi:MAG TPA: helix-turn-helix domain-containing protein [Anaerolineales bacterium]|jgi:transcriptional regulator with XRE-family HTH domain|nr:cupin [Anaerolineae bacterium]HRJ55910.1 helix-turn-helix domain-containing protein [Anaerolineales bacterium]HRK91273.1 helix-turn-helix domain-containing protein [Anaerolineales bacterium]